MKPMPDTLIRASAGSGKTFQLTRRYIALLLAGHDPATILATTFTVKAAGEIVRKVFEVLAGAILDPRKLTELSAQVNSLSPIGERAGGDALSPTRERADVSEANAGRGGRTETPAPKPERGLTSDDCRKAIHRLIVALPVLRICTLDSLFVRTLMTQSLRFGLPMEFDVVESEQHAKLIDRALDLALQEQLAGQGGVDHLMGLVYAVEKGKAQRSPWDALHELTGKPHEVFMDARPEAWRRLKTPPEVPEAQLQQAVKDLESYDEEKAITRGIREDLARFNEGKWDKFIDTGVAKKVREEVAEFNRKPIPAHVRKAMSVLLRQAAHVLVGQVAAKNEAIFTLLQGYDAHYAGVKRDERSYAFGDLPVLLAKADFNPFLGQCASIDHVLLDEFQDTSVNQWRALRPVLGDLRGKPDRSFFCVGDVKQAIYGWRGGSAELFTRVPVEVPDLQEKSLEVSWRSSPVIIDFVNVVFAKIAENTVLQRWSSAASVWQQAFKPHFAQKKDPGYIRIETAPAADRDADRRLPTLRYAAAQVKALHRSAPHRSIGVLTRTNDAVARLIFELGEMDVRASEEGGVPLTDSSAVLVILSALTMADHPADTTAVFNLENSPLAAAIGMETEEDIQPAAREIRKELLLHGYGPVIARWVAALAPHCDARNLARLQHLERLAFRQMDADPLRPGEFVEFIRTQQVEDPSSSLVRVMTIHKAKGLEFDIVVLPDLDRNLVGNRPLMVAGRSAPADPFDVVCCYASDAVRDFFPENIKPVFSRYWNAAAGEALCNLYVAITRPRHALHVILAPSKDTERTLPKTYAGVIRGALGLVAPLAPGSLVYESGDPEWVSQVQDHGRPRPPQDRGRPRPPRAVKTTSPTNDYPLFAAMDLTEMAEADPRDDESSRLTSEESSSPSVDGRILKPGRTRFFPRTTPSEQAEEKSVQIPALFDVSGNMGAERGTAIHALFQVVGWLDEERPSDDQLVRALPPEHRAGSARFLTDFRAMLAKAAIRDRLSRSFYERTWSDRCGNQSLELRLYRELPFAHLDGEQLISGKIDRLVIGYAQGKAVAAEVLDYKTDVGEPADLVAHYAPQMAAYRQAAARITHLPTDTIASQLVLLRRGLIAAVTGADTPLR